MAETMTLRLNGPGMTGLHKVGLAGLYMTLDVLGSDPGRSDQLRALGMNWSLSPTSIDLNLDPPQRRQAFEKLVELSFGVRNGFFAFAGLEKHAPPQPQHDFLLHRAMLGSFLQFGPHRPTGSKETREVDLGGSRPLRVADFQPIQSYRHQEASSVFLTAKGDWCSAIELAGWLYPGGAQRHVAVTASKLQEPPELALCLLFAPVGAVFFDVRSRTRGRKARTALVVPQIRDLAAYAELRRSIENQGVLKMTAIGASDAALRFAIMIKSYVTAIDTGLPLRVYTFGIVDWNEKQKTRTHAASVTLANLPDLTNYELALSYLDNRVVRRAAQSGSRGQKAAAESWFVDSRTTLGLVAENTAAGRAWYTGFADFASKGEVRDRLKYERKELNAMTLDANYQHERERVFVRACHEAWRRRLGQLGARARGQGVSFERLAEREYERQRVAFARCKNASSLRETVTDFWSRAGSLPELREHWSDVLPMLGDSDWRSARDLALLALASYASPDDSNANASASAPADDTH